MGRPIESLPALSAADVVPDGVEITAEIRQRARIPHDLRIVVEPIGNPHGALVHAIRGKRHGAAFAAREQDLADAVWKAVHEVSHRTKRSTP